MATETTPVVDESNAATPAIGATWRSVVGPAAFSTADGEGASGLYLREWATRDLAGFFERKGLLAIKQEDQLEKWYDDWIAYQAEHELYAAVLSPKQFSTKGRQFDLLRYARFLEVIAYFSPSHAYSLQVTFLGLFSIQMGENEALKREAVTALEAGGQFAFGVSEKQHGSDLLGNEFTVRPAVGGQFVANGSKYYIGNANCASIIAVLARKDDPTSSNGREKRAPFVLFGLRPKQANAFGNLRKIRTFGVKAGFVGSFDVKEHDLPETDLLADGRGAWDAVIGTVTLGKFFLGFGSIGICQHAFAEALAHLKQRKLYGKPVIEMPHIRAAAAQAAARLVAMKLYAYRAIDYVHAATADDRRYLFFCAVQKAKVSTEGVKVMTLLSECVGAKGFEADTFFEMALRDVQLIPLLESSAHINLGFTAQFIGRYFGSPANELAAPPSLASRETPATENPYLTTARSNAINAIFFPPHQRAYGPLIGVPNVKLFAAQARTFRLFTRAIRNHRDLQSNISIGLGQCMATIAYGQLVAENAVKLGVPDEIVSAIFHLLVADLSTAAQALAATPGMDKLGRVLLRRMVVIPKTTDADWGFVSAQCL